MWRLGPLSLSLSIQGFVFILTTEIVAFGFRDAIDTLEREGLVYSSIDDDHYKAVEGC